MSHTPVFSSTCWQCLSSHHLHLVTSQPLGDWSSQPYLIKVVRIEIYHSLLAFCICWKNLMKTQNKYFVLWQVMKKYPHVRLFNMPSHQAEGSLLMTLQLKVTLMLINYKIRKEAIQENKGEPRALPASLCSGERSRESSWLGSLHGIRTYQVKWPGNSQLTTCFFIKPGKRRHLPKKTSPLLYKEILAMTKLPPFNIYFLHQW